MKNIKLEINRKHPYSTSYKIMVENVVMSGRVEKDEYGIWFVTTDILDSYTADQLEAIAKAMREVK